MDGATEGLPFPPFAGIEQLQGRGPRIPRPERLDRPVGSLPGVGPKVGASLAALGILTVRDLLSWRPRRYEPPAPLRRVTELIPGEEVTVEGVVERVGSRKARRRRLTIVEAAISDGTGTVTAIWFNQTWLLERLQPGTALTVRGVLERGELAVRDQAFGAAEALRRVSPIYPASEALSSRRLRTMIENVLPEAADLGDPLPAGLRARMRLPLRPDAITALHRPSVERDGEAGRRRLAFDELLALQVGLARRRGTRAEVPARELGAPGELISRYRAALPFELTPAQERAIAEIDRDLGVPAPMERLLQGDVGSGKTVVALYALLRAVERGHQGALMAPTETLAEQHCLTLERLCAPLEVSVRLVTSSLPAAELRDARAAIESGEASIAVGTHALIQEGVRFHSLAVSVVDEQHRFGVEQRAALARPAGAAFSPHRLHMTATPIPRTLALTVWGDLSVSEIDRPPSGRKPVVTRWVTDDLAGEAYLRLRRHLADGRQAYVVCPLVSPSEAIEARAAEAEAERLRCGELADFRVGCLHGQLRPAERRRLMDEFSRRELDVLVATTVIEVGVDVPNATIMIVQEADRFGLAQLHQLRGRVGRGSEQSYCLLVSRPKSELTDVACDRLQALVDTSDGFELAEVDLELRGAGAFLGTRQTGMSDLRFTRLRADQRLLGEARKVAEALADTEGPLDDEVERLFGRAPDALA